jgi:hypothetical protein
LVLSFNPSSWFCWMFSCIWVVLCKNVCCSWCYYYAGRMRAASPGGAHLVDSWFCQQLWCCQLQLSSSVTKLLVSCVLVSFTQLDLIHPWPCYETAMHYSAMYPQWFKRTYTALGHLKTQWCNGKVLAKVWE